MSQAQERSWRRERLLAASQSSRRDRRVFLSGIDVCLTGFAIIVGGTSYIRVCYSTIHELKEASATEGEKCETINQ